MFSRLCSGDDPEGRAGATAAAEAAEDWDTDGPGKGDEMGTMGELVLDGGSLMLRANSGVGDRGTGFLPDPPLPDSGAGLSAPSIPRLSRPPERPLPVVVMENDRDFGMVREIDVGEDGDGELLRLPCGELPGVLSRECRKLELRVRTGSLSSVGRPVALVVVVHVLVDILRIKLGGRLLLSLCTTQKINAMELGECKEHNLQQNSPVIHHICQVRPVRCLYWPRNETGPRINRPDPPTYLQRICTALPVVPRQKYFTFLLSLKITRQSHVNLKYERGPELERG